MPADWEPTTTCREVSKTPTTWQQNGQGAYDLWQVQGVVANGVEDEVLKLVDGDEQILAEGSHDCGWAGRVYAAAAVRETTRGGITILS